MESKGISLVCTQVVFIYNSSWFEMDLLKRAKFVCAWTCSVLNVCADGKIVGGGI